MGGHATDVPALLESLAQALENARVSYCQWKGHFTRDRWAAGEGDIDLLVARADAERFDAVASQCGFKQVVVPARAAVAGTTHFFAFDVGTGGWLHLHVHRQLALGPGRRPNYWLPIERAVLAASQRGPILRIPHAEHELLLFVLRGVLTQPVWRREADATRARRQAELQYLLGRRTRDGGSAAGGILPRVDVRTLSSCVRALAAGAGPWDRLAAKVRLHRRLREHARSSLTAAFVSRAAGALSRRAAAPFGLASPRPRPAAGGLVVALVGGDGAGKSTAVADLVRWLSPRLDVRSVHMGKPRRSLATLAVGALGRALGGGSRLLAIALPASRHTAERALRWLVLVRAVCIARDRARLYRRLRRWMGEGSIVLCDRYPVSSIRRMDGPVISESLPIDRATPSIRLLAAAERRWYESILPPDLLLVLRVDPEHAVRRKQGDEAAYVRARCREVWMQDPARVPGMVVDANQSRAAVLARLQAAVWEAL